MNLLGSWAIRNGTSQVPGVVTRIRLPKKLLFQWILQNQAWYLEPSGYCRLLRYVPWAWPICTQPHRTQFADVKRSPYHLFVLHQAVVVLSRLIHCDHVSSGSYFSLDSHCIVRVDFCAAVMLRWFFFWRFFSSLIWLFLLVEDIEVNGLDLPLFCWKAA